MGDELVFVVPRAAIMGTDGWHGIRDVPLHEFLEIIVATGRYEARAAMEEDPSFKQVIPYLVLRDAERYFLMRRTRAGGDARLHDLYSIGVGGHLNPGDGGLEQGLRREWLEELNADFVPEFRLVGVLNDDTTAVGRVHVGAVFQADANGRPVAIRETDKLEGAFALPGEVGAVRDRMETWSRLTFDHLENGRLRAERPSGRPVQ
jgi:predicted NUDIX family phosphoesterase